MGFPFYKKNLYADLKTKYNSEDGMALVSVPCDMTKNVTALHKKLYGEKVYKANSKVKSISKSLLKKKVYTKSGSKYKEIKATYANRNKSLDNKY